MDKIQFIVGGNGKEGERKNTMKFDEDMSKDEHGREFCRNIYVSKVFLEKLGWTPGRQLKVSIELA